MKLRKLKPKDIPVGKLVELPHSQKGRIWINSPTEGVARGWVFEYDNPRSTKYHSDAYGSIRKFCNWYNRENGH